MFSAIRQRAAVRRARAAHRMVVLEGLIEANRARLDELAELDECRFCVSVEREKVAG